MTELPERILSDMRRSRRLVVIMDIGKEGKPALALAHFNCDLITAIGIVEMAVAGSLHTAFRGAVPTLDVGKDDLPMFEVKKKGDE